MWNYTIHTSQYHQTQWLVLFELRTVGALARKLDHEVDMRRFDPSCGFQYAVDSSRLWCPPFIVPTYSS